MSIGKMAITGAIGFAIGAGAMMMPSNQKLRRKMIGKMDKMTKLAKSW